jgi:hypothetical protein
VRADALTWYCSMSIDVFAYGTRQTYNNECCLAGITVYIYIYIYIKIYI